MKWRVGEKLIRPLSLTIRGGPSVIVRDRRTDEPVPLIAASSTIAAAILWDLAPLFFAVPADARMLVVEEPELAMTPLQQIAFIRALRKIAERASGENYVIVTTHTPYVAASCDQPSLLFSFDTSKKVFEVKETNYPPPFTKADYLLLAEAVSGGST